MSAITPNLRLTDFSGVAPARRAGDVSRADDAYALELSVVMPCLNEAETLASCIKKAQRWMQKNNVAGEVIIADDGSTDGSQAIATVSGARVIDAPTIETSPDSIQATG